MKTPSLSKMETSLTDFYICRSIYAPVFFMTCGC